MPNCCAVPARSAWVVPEGFDVKLASVMPVAVGTADDCLFEFGHLKAGAGHWCWCRLAAPAGSAPPRSRLAKRAGARVFATASSDERLEKLRPLGMDEGINYRTHDVVTEVMRLTDKKGVDLVVDSVGGSTLQGSILSPATVAGSRWSARGGARAG